MTPTPLPNVPFPKHSIDPKQKDKKWRLNAAKAMWSYAARNCTNIFYHAAEQYDKWHSYRVAGQSVNAYKPAMGVGEADDASSNNIDWTPWAWACKFIDIAVSRMIQREYNIVATPIDPLAKDKADEYFADARTKILMRDALKKVGQAELAESPNLRPNPGEPENLEELEMQMNYGFKYNMAMEAEMGINLLMYQNDMEDQRWEIIESLVNAGVAGYKEWIDEEGKVKFRACDNRNVIMSFCRKPNFKDKRWVGEVIEVPLGELEQYFNEDEIAKIRQVSKDSQRGNSIDYASKTYTGDEVVRVLDFQFKSWNDQMYRRYVNEEGNTKFDDLKYSTYMSYSDEKKREKVVVDGKEKSRYFSKRVEVWYKGKWIVDTDYVYDDGLLENMKRDKAPERIALTDSEYHFQAVNFKDMTAQGMMSKLQPIIDELQLTIYRIQNFKNKWIPYLIEIDFDALENVAYGKSGEALSPDKILDFVVQNHALIVRKRDMIGNNVNYKAVDIVNTGMAQEFAALVSDVPRLIQAMRDVTGLNEVTDSSSPNPKLLKSVANMANQGTNNALYPMMMAEKLLTQQLAKALIQRLVFAVKKGKVQGVAEALGSGTVKFITVSPDVALHDWGIKIEDRPTDEDLTAMFQRFGLTDTTLLQPEDVLMLKNTPNDKQREILLVYKVKKRKEEAQQKAMMDQEMNAKVQQSSTIVAEEEKRKSLEMEHKFKMEQIREAARLERENILLKNQAPIASAQINADAKVESAHIAADAKRETASQPVTNSN